MRKGCWSRAIALRMVRNFRMQAVRATFLSLPRFNKCWYCAWISGLWRVATSVDIYSTLRTSPRPPLVLKTLQLFGLNEGWTWRSCCTTVSPGPTRHRSAMSFLRVLPDLVVGRAKLRSPSESISPFRRLVLPPAGNASRWAIS